MSYKPLQTLYVVFPKNTVWSPAIKLHHIAEANHTWNRKWNQLENKSESRLKSLLWQTLFSSLLHLLTSFWFMILNRKLSWSGQCYTLNQGSKDHKCTLGPITWSGSNEQTRQGRLSASRELWLQPMKVAPLAPMCSQISEHLGTKSLRDSGRMIQRAVGDQTRGRLSSK